MVLDCLLVEISLECICKSHPLDLRICCLIGLLMVCWSFEGWCWCLVIGCIYLNFTNTTSDITCFGVSISPQIGIRKCWTLMGSVLDVDKWKGELPIGWFGLWVWRASLNNGIITSIFHSCFGENIGGNMTFDGVMADEMLWEFGGNELMLLM